MFRVAQEDRVEDGQISDCVPLIQLLDRRGR